LFFRRIFGIRADVACADFTGVAAKIRTGFGGHSGIPHGRGGARSYRWRAAQ
jgi:hypothetical protein